MVRARQALDLGLTKDSLRCECDACEIPTDEKRRALAERVCKAACDFKCPPKAATCPLRRF